MPKAIIYEPFLHYIPTGNGWECGLKKLNWKVYKLPEFEYRINDIDEMVDLLIIHGLDEKKCDEILNFKNIFPNTKIVIVCSDYFPFYNKVFSCVSLWVNPYYQHTIIKNQFIKNNLNFINTQLAASEDIFFPLNKNKIYDVSFIGQVSHGYRGEDKFLFPLINTKYKGIFGGFSYNNINYHPIYHSYLNEIYNITKVNINFHYPYQKEEKVENVEYRLELNGRIFEIAMSGNFQITDNLLVKKFFGESIPIANEKNWLETIDYYLSNESECKRLSNISREICLKYHSYKNRAETILNHLQ